MSQKGEKITFDHIFLKKGRVDFPACACLPVGRTGRRTFRARSFNLWDIFHAMKR
jgi:hypothetical protein